MGLERYFCNTFEGLERIINVGDGYDVVLVGKRIMRENRGNGKNLTLLSF
jgi:hypothetical protein